jgi:hypothetical protein
MEGTDALIIRPRIASMYFEKVLDDVFNCILIVVIPHCLNNVSLLFFSSFRHL